MTKILIRGNFSEGNFGDDALLLACHQLINEIGISTRVRYNCKELAYNKDLAADAKITNSKEIHKATLIIYAGGTQFFSFAKNTSIKNSTYHYFKNKLSAFKWSISQKSKYALIGIGFGPFTSKSGEKVFASTIAKKASFLWVRDKYSFNFSNISNAKNPILGSDLCFLPRFQEWCDIESNISNKIQRIGIVIRDWKFGDGNNYLTKISSLAKELTYKKYDIRFYLFSENNDPICEEFLKSKNICYYKWNAKKDIFKNYLRNLQTCDLFITSRYHAAVFSALMQKPFIIIGLEQKLTLFSSQFNETHTHWDPSDSIKNLLIKVDYINSNYTTFKDNTINTKMTLEKMTQSSASAFKKFINSMI